MDTIEHADEQHTVEVDAPVAAVWALVSDITRTPEWSPVVTESHWVGDPAGPVVGARFRGHNRFNGFRWSRECVVTEADAPRVFAFSTFGADGREQTRWRYMLDPIGAGTRVSLAYQVITLPRWVAFLRRVPGAAKTSARQATANLTSSLQRLADLAAQGPP